jgi:superfamily II DNA or RNA helicase
MAIITHDRGDRKSPPADTPTRSAQRRPNRQAVRRLAHPAPADAPTADAPASAPTAAPVAPDAPTPIMARPTLRDYQARAANNTVHALRAGEDRCYFSQPTGCGKAVVLAALADYLAQRGRVVLVAHREELITQLAAQCARFAPGRVGVVMARQNDLHQPIIVGSIQTLRPARLAQLIAVSPTPIVALLIDECHHVAPHNTYDRLITTLADACPGVAVVGCTATPFRADKTVMQQVLPFCVDEQKLDEMIAAGWLAPLRLQRVAVPMQLADLVFGPKRADEERDYQTGALELEAMRPAVIDALIAGTAPALRERADAPAVAFAVSVAHAHRLAEAYTAAGIPAAVVWGAMPKVDRHVTLDRWRAGDLHLVCNVGVLTEGFDLAALATIVMARPTRSLGLYMQMLGRGTRIAPNKQDCLVLEATAGRPDPKQITLAHVVPVDDDDDEISESGQPSDDDGENAAPHKNRISTLTMLDPRADPKWRWVFYADCHIYTLPISSESALWLIRDPDTARGSGLYRAAVISTEPHRAAHISWLPTLQDAALPLQEIKSEAGAWLRTGAHAAVALATKAQRQGWRASPPTEKQSQLLQRHAPTLLTPDLTRGQASDVIDSLFLHWRARGVIASVWHTGVWGDTRPTGKVASDE